MQNMRNCAGREVVREIGSNNEAYVYDKLCAGCMASIDASAFTLAPRAEDDEPYRTFNLNTSDGCPGSDENTFNRRDPYDLENGRFITDCYTSIDNETGIGFGFLEKNPRSGQERRNAYTKEPDLKVNAADIALQASGSTQVPVPNIPTESCILGKDYEPKKTGITHILLTLSNGDRKIVSDATNYLDIWDPEGGKYNHQGGNEKCGLRSALMQGVPEYQFFICDGCKEHRLLSVDPLSEGVSIDHTVDLRKSQAFASRLEPAEATVAGEQLQQSSRVGKATEPALNDKPADGSVRAKVYVTGVLTKSANDQVSDGPQEYGQGQSLEVTPNGGKLGAFVYRNKVIGPLEVEFPFGCGIVEQHNRLDDPKNPRSLVQKGVNAVWGTSDNRKGKPLDIDASTIPERQLKNIANIALLGFTGKFCDGCRVVDCDLNRMAEEALVSDKQKGYYEFEV